MKLLLAVVVFCIGAIPIRAQEPVRRVPDAVTWLTASANPIVAVILAARSDAPRCRLTQLGISGGITTTVGLLAQHYVTSPRPCVGSPGCSGNGAPSLHTAWGVLGISRGVHSGLGITFSVAMAVGTAGGRVDAKRHTPWQVLEGLALGSAAEWAGQRLLRCDTP